MSTNDVALVRLIARRYRALQGLRTTIDAVALLLLWSLLQIPGASRRSGPYVIAVVVWAVLATWGESKAARFYRERFGRVVGKKGDDSPAARVLLLWFVISMGGMIGAALPFVITYAAIITWRDWPYRSHWALLVITGLVFAVSFAGLASPHDLTDWQRRFVWTAAPVLAIVGLLDHRLLMRAMRTEALPDTEHADAI